MFHPVAWKLHVERSSMHYFRYQDSLKLGDEDIFNSWKIVRYTYILDWIWEKKSNKCPLKISSVFFIESQRNECTLKHCKVTWIHAVLYSMITLFKMEKVFLKLNHQCSCAVMLTLLLWLGSKTGKGIPSEKGRIVLRMLHGTYYFYTVILH